MITAAVRAQPPSYYGAAWAAGPFWFIGLGAIVFAVCWAFSSTRGLGWSIVLLATVVPMSQAMMYGMPTVQVAARHIGIVQQLITNNGLDRNEGIYQAYSGLFTSSALVQQAAGWSDMMLYAAVFGAVGAGVNCLAVAAWRGISSTTSAPGGRLWCSRSDPASPRASTPPRWWAWRS